MYMFRVLHHASPILLTPTISLSVPTPNVQSITKKKLHNDLNYFVQTELEELGCFYFIFDFHSY